MKYYKSIIIIMLAIFLFSIASVCASDANDTQIASEDTVQMELTETDGLSPTYDNPETAEGDTQAVEESGNGAISTLGKSQDCYNETNYNNPLSNEKDVLINDAAKDSPAAVDLSVEMTVDKDTALVGNVLTYTIVITNNGPSNATNIKYVDIFDDGLMWVGGEEDAVIPNLGIGESVNIILKARAREIGIFMNRVNVTCNENDAVKSAYASVQVLNKDLQIITAADIGEVFVGNVVNFTINVTNHSPTAANGVHIVDKIDGAFEFVNASEGYVINGQSIYWIVSDMIPNEPSSFWVVLRALDAGTITSFAQVNCSEEPTLRNTTSSVAAYYPTVLTSDELTTDYNIEKDLVITLTYDNGKPITGADIAVELNGVENYTTDKNGTVRLSTAGLPVGNYTAKITFSGNGTYYKSNKTVKVTINKAQTSINASDLITIYNEDDYLTVTLTDSQNRPIGGAKLSVDLNGLDDYNTNENGTIKISTGALPADIYSVKIDFAGNQNYSQSNATVKVTVNRASSTLTIDNDIIFEYNTNGSTTISFTGAIGVNAYVINHTDAVVNVSNNKTITVSGLDVGTYTLAVTTVPDANHYEVTRTANITVSKVNPEIGMNATLNGDNLTINVTAPGDVTKPALVDVDSVGYYVNLTGGKGQLVISGLSGGWHSVVAKYPGDDRYNQSESIFKSFEVCNIPSAVSVKADSITYGDKAIIEVSVPDDATGNVTVTIGGKPYSENVSCARALFIVTGLGVGNYTVNVNYNGDKKYASNDNSTRLEVCPIKIGEKDISVVDEGNGTVVVVVFKNATGNITLKVENNTYYSALADGMAVITLDNVTPGEHDVDVIYWGDENHEGNSIVSTITAPKWDSPLTVVVQDIKYGQPADIMVIVLDNATGNVSIEIDGVRYIDEVHDGVVDFNIENLTAGIRTIYIEYTGDDNYVKNHTTANLTVTKINPEIRMSVTLNGDNLTINVTAPGDVTKPVLVNLDVKGYYLNLTDGKGQLVISGLSGGWHSVVAKYSGDDGYNQSESQPESFEVCNIPSGVSVKADNITCGDKAVIEVSVPNDATGNVTVTIGGKPYSENVSSAKAIFIVTGLGAGNYTVNVTYSGDKKYASNDNSIKLEVCPIKIGEKDISVIDYGNGTVVVVVFKNATGNITLKVENNTYYSALADGMAVITVDNETPGEHDVDVIYWGDESHEGNSIVSTITAPKWDSLISVDVPGVEYGQTADIIVYVPENATGNVSIEIDGVRYIDEVRDAVAKFSIENLTAGIRTIFINYKGDDNYCGNHTTANLTVSKADPEIRLNVVVDGDNLAIDVIAPEDATNPVLLDVDGDGYYVNLTDGKGRLSISGLSGGWHSVVAKYSGDDRYNQSESQPESFEVCNISSAVSVKAESIIYGDKAVIEVSVPDDATGNVTVTIGGKPYTENVSNAKAILIVTGLDAGNYMINATYNGDVKYASGSNSTNLDVSKAKISIKVIDKGNGTVAMVVSDNILSNVVIKVGINIYEAVVEDAIAMIDLVNETSGVHDIEVICAGDENHDAAYANVSITVNKLNTQITANAITTTYNVNKNLVISLKDVKGNPVIGAKITVDLNGVKTYTTDKNGNIKVSLKGLPSNTYTAAITFKGNDNYEKSMGFVKVSVKKATPKITAKKKTFKAKTKTKKYTVTLKDNTGKAMKKAKVTLKVKGKTFKATTNSKGKATFKIKNLKKKGKYTAVIKYKGDKNYKKVTKKVKLTVKASKKKKSTFKTLSKGSKDKATIKKIQKALQKHGYYIKYKDSYLKIDGIYHGYTERAVKEFQKDKGLKVTGNVDEKTAKKLGII